MCRGLCPEDAVQCSAAQRIAQSHLSVSRVREPPSELCSTVLCARCRSGGRGGRAGDPALQARESGPAVRSHTLLARRTQVHLLWLQAGVLCCAAPFIAHCHALPTVSPLRFFTSHFGSARLSCEPSTLSTTSYNSDSF